MNCQKKKSLVKKDRPISPFEMMCSTSPWFYSTDRKLATRNFSHNKLSHT